MFFQDRENQLNLFFLKGNIIFFAQFAKREQECHHFFLTFGLTSSAVDRGALYKHLIQKIKLCPVNVFQFGVIHPVIIAFHCHCLQIVSSFP